MTGPDGSVTAYRREAVCNWIRARFDDEGATMAIYRAEQDYRTMILAKLLVDALGAERVVGIYEHGPGNVPKWAKGLEKATGAKVLGVSTQRNQVRVEGRSLCTVDHQWVETPVDDRASAVYYNHMFWGYVRYLSDVLYGGKGLLFGRMTVTDRAVGDTSDSGYCDMYPLAGFLDRDIKGLYEFTLQDPAVRAMRNGAVFDVGGEKYTREDIDRAMCNRNDPLHDTLWGRVDSAPSVPAWKSFPLPEGRSR